MKLKHNPKVIFREEEDVGLLFNPDTGRINILNETGKFIWSCLEGEKTRGDIIESIVSVFDVPDKKKAGDDFDTFVKNLGKLGFLDGYKDIPAAPVSVCFGITSKCNFSCKHCLNRDIPGAGPDMTTAELIKVIDQMAEGGTKDLSLFGGEPLCHPDFKLIVEHINKYPISISLNTNGSLIDRDMARWLMAHRITGAVVSFDGSDAAIMDGMRGEGAFKASLRGIEAMRAEGMTVLLSVTLTRLNYRNIREMVSLGKRSGGSSIRFNHVFFAGNAACFARELYLSPEEERLAIDVVWQAKEESGDFISAQSSYLCQKKKLEKVKYYKAVSDKIVVPPCGAAKGKCAIRPDGWVTPCEIIWDVKCGNVKTERLGDIWRDSEVMNSFRKPIEIDLKDMPECKGCQYQYMCFIGHRCYPYYYPGGIADRSMYCWRP